MDIFVQNFLFLTFLTLPSLQILEKTQIGVISDFQIFDQCLINKNFQTPETVMIYDIDVKLEQVTKPDKIEKHGNVTRI